MSFISDPAIIKLNN